MHIHVFIIMDADAVQKVYCLPEWHVMTWYRGGDRWHMIVVKDDILSDLYSATIIVLVCHPNEIAFGALQVSQEFAGFSAHFELRQLVRNDAQGAMCPEWVEVGEVRLVVEPQFEGGGIWWQSHVWHSLLYVCSCEDGKWPEVVLEV
jgi:hypothetical protein